MENLMINTMLEGYILHKGELKSYKLLEITANFSTGRIRYKSLIGGAEEWLSETPRTYHSEDDFRNGEEYPATDTKPERVMVSAFGFYPRSEGGRWMVFAYKDGKAARIDAGELKYIYTDRGWTCDTKCYLSERELCRWQDVTVTEEDGSTRKLRSIAGLVAVKPEQQVIVGELKGVLERAAEAGLRIIADYECCELRVMDGSRISEIELLYDEDGASDERKVEIDPDMMQKIRVIAMYDHGANQRFAAYPWKKENE